MGSQAHQKAPIELRTSTEQYLHIYIFTLSNYQSNRKTSNASIVPVGSEVTGTQPTETRTANLRSRGIVQPYNYDLQQRYKASCT